MSQIIAGNMVGGSLPMKTVMFEDADGNQIMGVVVGSEVMLTATDADVRKGKVYVSDNGVSVGTLEV
jgi:hypothetical protein